MNKNEMFDHLIATGYVVEASKGDFVLSNKLKRDMPKPKTESTILATALTPRQVFDKFKRDCKIPFDAMMSSGGRYELAAANKTTVNYVYKLIASNKHDYKDVVAAVGQYYGDTSRSRKTMLRFFKEGTFDAVMEVYLKGKQTSGVFSAGINNVGGRIQL